MNEIQSIINTVEQTPEYWVEIAKLDFARLLNDRITKENIGYNELSKKAGVSKSHILRILSGDANFTVETMVKLMFALTERINITSQSLEMKIS